MGHPCSFNGQGDDVWQNDMRAYWEPLFDAHHVAVAFENHLHRYGRAVPLKAGKVCLSLTLCCSRKSDLMGRRLPFLLQADPEGTLYLGGGSFGVTPSSNNCTTDWLSSLFCGPSGNPWYMANVQQKRHFLLVNVRLLFATLPLLSPNIKS